MSSPPNQSSPPAAPWRPPSRSNRSAHNKSLFIAIAVSLIVAFFVLTTFARVASRHPDKVNLGDRTFRQHHATQRVQQAKVGPIFFNDLVRDNRPLPLVVSWLGGSKLAALNALPEGSAEKCTVTWDAGKKVFLDPCTQTVYAPDGKSDDGKSLIRYKLTVSKLDVLEIDLNTRYQEP